MTAHFDSAMVRFGSQRDHRVERGVFQIVEIFRPVLGQIHANLVHDGQHERIGQAIVDVAATAARVQAATVDEHPRAEYPPHQTFGDRGADAVEIAGEQNRAGRRGHRHPRQCSAQIRVNNRRDVSKSTSTLPARRAFNSADPSSWRPRRPMSKASIREGVAWRMAS